MEEVKYIGSIDELVTATEPPDPRKTAVALVRLPNTKFLDPRYAFVMSGPESEQVAKIVASIVDQIAQKAGG